MSSNISANTLFHFTSKIENLKSILSTGFYSRYCIENYEEAFENGFELAIPMVCFCDIPISNAKTHSSNYGKYAIGLTKRWGMENGLSPVIYTYPNALTSEMLATVQSKIKDYFDKTISKVVEIKGKKNEFESAEIEQAFKSNFNHIVEMADHATETYENLSSFFKFLKPYEGNIISNEDSSLKKVRFYEEREWRFIPDKFTIKNAKVDSMIPGFVCKNPVIRRALNIKIATHTKLKFRPNDILFIIVKNDTEIPEMISFIEDVLKGNPKDEIKLLCTRLISLEHIIENI